MLENLRSARKNWSKVLDLLSFCSPMVSSTLSCLQGPENRAEFAVTHNLCLFFCLVLFLGSTEEVFKQPN